MGLVKKIYKFLTFPLTPSSAPTSDYEVANKKYVDDNIGGGASLWTAWNASRTDNSTIASNSADDDLPVGTLIRYNIDGGAWRLGFVDTVAARAHTLRGYPCVEGSNNFQYDASNLKMLVIQIPIPDNFNDADVSTYCLDDLLLKAGLRPFSCPENYILGIDPVCTSVDTTADPTMNILVHGGANAVFASEVALNVTVAKSTLTETAGEYYKFGIYGQFDIKMTKNGAGNAYNGDVKIYIGRA